MQMIDLRSDTITQPTDEMRRVMASAEVGDDVFGDDPTVNRLQERVAQLYGMEAALFVPSGTMANQVAIRSHTEPGNEIICHKASHINLYEGGAPAALSGCALKLLDGDRGMFTAADVQQAVAPDDPHCASSRLVVLENTQNRGGGSIWSLDDVAAIRKVADQHDLRMHLDGARIMNACVAANCRPSDYGQYFHSATICFSKGLGAPIGSAVAGSNEFIARVKRFRKMFGGAMRQAGLIAAAAEYALDHHVDRLAEDHANARRLAEQLQQSKLITASTPETNLVFFEIDESAGPAGGITARLKEDGVWVLPTTGQRVRAVLHLHISKDQVDQAAEKIIKQVESHA